MSDNPNDKVESKRLAVAAARAKRADRKYWASEGPKVLKGYAENQKKLSDYLAKNNDPKRASWKLK